MLEITAKRKASRYLKRLNANTRARIEEKIEEIAADPNGNHGIVPLKGRAGFRVRVGDCRVIFDMDDESMNVQSIGPRGDIYKE